MSDLPPTDKPPSNQLSYGEHRWPAARGATRVIETWVFWLDNALRVPGTSFRIGLDPVLGLIPGVGDALGGVMSLGVVFLALQYGLPVQVVAKMVWNIAVDAGLGSVPAVGDVFDFAWRANRKNLELLREHQSAQLSAQTPARRGRHRLQLVLLTLLAVVCVVLPVAVTAWLLYRWLSGVSEGRRLGGRARSRRWLLASARARSSACA